MPSEPQPRVSENCKMSETHNKCWHCGKGLDRPLHTVYINRGIHDDCERDVRNADLLRIEIAQLREQLADDHSIQVAQYNIIQELIKQLAAAEAKIARVREQRVYEPHEVAMYDTQCDAWYAKPEIHKALADDEVND